jgi:hypothetical protein
MDNPPVVLANPTPYNAQSNLYYNLVCLDSCFPQEHVLPAQPTSPPVPLPPMELLAWLDSICPLHSLHVLLAHHLLLNVQLPLFSLCACQLTTQLQLPETRSPVPLAQQPTTSLIASTLPMLPHANPVSIQITECAQHALLIHRPVPVYKF